MKYIIMSAFCFAVLALSAQQKQQQFILVIRSKADLKASAKTIDTNILYWQQYMEELGREGKISAGYRPAIEGVTIEGKNKTIKQSGIWPMQRWLVLSLSSTRSILLKPNGLP